MVAELQQIGATKKVTVAKIQRPGNRAVSLFDAFGDLALSATHARVTVTRKGVRRSILVPITRKDRKVILTLKRSPLKPKPRIGEKVSVTLFVDRSISHQTFFRATFFSIDPASGEYNIRFLGGVQLFDEIVDFKGLFESALEDAGPIVRLAVESREGELIRDQNDRVMTESEADRRKKKGETIIIKQRFSVRGGFTYIVVAGGKDRKGQLRRGAKRIKRRQGGFNAVTGVYSTSTREPKREKKDKRGDDKRPRRKTSRGSNTGGRSRRGKRRKKSKK